MDYSIKLILVLLAGIAAGFINIVAGGGSALTIPSLIFLGLPTAVANGTNRIALIIGGAIGISRFKKKGYFDLSYGLEISIPAVVGAILGSLVAVDLPDEIFKKILAVVMIIVLIITLLNPEKKNPEGSKTLSPKRKILSMIVFLLVGFYGGLIQVGVGFVIMASLSLLTHFSLVRINSLKTFIVPFYLIFSLAVFAYHGKVDWLYGLLLGIGNSIGAWLGTTFTVTKGDRWVKGFLTIAVIAMVLKLLKVY